MRHVPRVLLIAVGSVLTFGWTASRADDKIHACKDANGNVIYQDDPCTGNPGRNVAAPSGAGPVRTKPMMSTTEHRTNIPVKRVPPAGRAHPPQERGIVEQTGADQFPTNLDGAAHPPNVRFASPEQTWQAFLAAIRIGDRAAALACFTPSALTQFGPHAESFPLEELRETVSTFTRIEVEGDVGPFWSIRALRPHRRPKWIFFERTDRGEWKIAAI